MRLLCSGGWAVGSMSDRLTSILRCSLNSLEGKPRALLLGSPIAVGCASACKLRPHIHEANPLQCSHGFADPMCSQETPRSATRVEATPMPHLQNRPAPKTRFLRLFRASEGKLSACGGVPQAVVNFYCSEAADWGSGHTSGLVSDWLLDKRGSERLPEGRAWMLDSRLLVLAREASLGSLPYHRLLRSLSLRMWRWGLPGGRSLLWLFLHPLSEGTESVIWFPEEATQPLTARFRLLECDSSNGAALTNGSQDASKAWDLHDD